MAFMMPDVNVMNILQHVSKFFLIIVVNMNIMSWMMPHMVSKLMYFTS